MVQRIQSNITLARGELQGNIKYFSYIHLLSSPRSDIHVLQTRKVSSS